MPIPSRNVLLAFSVLNVLAVLLLIEGGEVVQGLIWAALSATLLWGMQKHKNGELIGQ